MHRLKLITMPKDRESIPKAVSSGVKMGVIMMMAALASISIPIMRKRMFNSKRMTILLLVMFPKNRGVITSIVMIASSIANYLTVSAAGVLTRVGGTNGPRLVLLFNMAITLIGILLAVYLNACLKRERAAARKG